MKTHISKYSRIPNTASSILAFQQHKLYYNLSNMFVCILTPDIFPINILQICQDLKQQMIMPLQLRWRLEESLPHLHMMRKTIVFATWTSSRRFTRISISANSTFGISLISPIINNGLFFSLGWAAHIYVYVLIHWFRSI